MQRNATRGRARRGDNARIQKTTVSHAALKKLFAVEVELVGVVVGVRGEGSGYRVGRLHATKQIVVNQSAVRDLGSNIGSGSEFLSSLVGGHHHIDGDFYVGSAG